MKTTLKTTIRSFAGLASRPTLFSRTACVALACTMAAAAQVAPGTAVAATKSLTGRTDLTLVSPAGATTNVTNLDPATVGTNDFDGAQAVLVDDNGFVIAGVAADNRTGTTPLPLTLRRILITGGTAVLDTALATLMQVQPNDAWTVTDIQRRRDGGYLVAATQLSLMPNPMPQAAVFIVTPGGAVTVVPTTGLAGGVLAGVADAGDRWIAGVAQPFFIFNAEIQSMPYTASGAAPYRVHQFVNVAGFGGVGVDADHTLLVVAPTSNGPVSRLLHAPNATPTAITGTPKSLDFAHVMPAPGLVVATQVGSTGASTLHVVDTTVGATSQWGSVSLAGRMLDITVRDNPSLYGAAATAPALPYLGTRGGRAASGNASFALRVGGAPAAMGAVLAGVGRTSAPSPFGTVLIDLSLPVLQVASFTIPNSGEARPPLPIPATPGLVGGTLHLQGAVASGGTLALTPGVTLTIE